MLPTPHPGRFTGRLPADTGALFLIGMRVNTLRGLRYAPWLVREMRVMQAELTAQADRYGYLGGQNWLARTTILVSYWRSAADVQRFASAPEATHLQPWRRFSRELTGSADVGVWHELYDLTANGYEGIYVNMPRFGLGLAGEHAPVVAGTATSRQRIATQAS